MLEKYLEATLLILTGSASGFVDSIAGGGGLINLPALSILFGAGPEAIGTNKIAGTSGALVALLVYWRAGHFDYKKSFAFTFWIVCGSFLGSKTAPLLPPFVFRWLLLLSCPVILWIVFQKDLWIRETISLQDSILRRSSSNYPVRIFLSGIICGFYDGVWGPGGGTFMFLALLVFARLPLFTALAASKLANTCSAAVALGSYAWGGYVHWKEGIVLGIGMAIGAYAGARLARSYATRMIRPLLVVVVSLLLLKLFYL